MTVYIPVPLSHALILRIEDGGAIVVPIRLTADQWTILAGGPEVFEEVQDFRQSLLLRIQSHVLYDPGTQRFAGKETTGMFLMNSRTEQGVVVPFNGKLENLLSINNVLDITDIPTGIPPIVRH